MKKYFFGYLFVRIAKILAIIVVLIGLAYAVFQFGQAEIAAESVRYLPNAALGKQLQELGTKLSEARQLVSDFVGGKQPDSQVNVRDFPTEIDSMGDFEWLAQQLERIDGDRQMLKRSVVERFEVLVDEIEKKLRAYAASVSPPEPSATPAGVSATPIVKATPVPKPTPTERKTLFSDRLSEDDVKERISQLDANAQFLKSLETTAENPENRSKLSESINQLDKLKTLLPSSFATASFAAIAPSTAPPNLFPSTAPASVPEPRKLLNAEKVADQVGQLRSSVRQVILSSWALDDAFDTTQGLVASERDKCRSATLAVERIWFSAVGMMAAGVIAMAFVAFLILVMADLTQTLLDTATNTGVMVGRSSDPPHLTKPL